MARTLQLKKSYNTFLKELMNYFSPNETSCKCGCGLNITSLLLDKLNQIRALFGKRIFVTSGARCETHNKAIGGATKSAHLSGEAVDLQRSEALLTLIQDKLVELDLYMEAPEATPTWIHIQVRPTVNRVFTPYKPKPADKGVKPLTHSKIPSESELNDALKQVEDKVLG